MPWYATIESASILNQAKNDTDGDKDKGCVQNVQQISGLAVLCGAWLLM